MEIFKDILGYDGIYAVSNLGNVISRKNGKIKVLRTGTTTSGYRKVHLNAKGFPVHRLIADAFIPNPENKPFVDHINRNCTDNRIENLRWATRSENLANTAGRSASGLKGAYKSHNKFRAQININGAFVNLGSYDTVEEAHAVYMVKAKELYGDFANA
jgi:hypothetical protein